MSVACVYLSRAAEGLAPLENFVESYRAIDSGMDHDLIVIFKGYAETDRLEAQERLSQFTYRSFEMDDAGFDITAYMGVIAQFDYNYFCFLNTFSVIKSEAWLRKLADNLQKPGVGMVSGSGSYESLVSTYQYIDSVAHHYLRRFMTPAKTWECYVAFLMRGHYAREMAIPKKTHIRMALRDLRHSFLFMTRKSYLQAMFSKGGEREWVNIWPHFPNPHLRSNAFMISRDLFQGFNFTPPMTKNESYEFESGRRSVSARIMEKGLTLLVVGADGIGYSVDQWPKSATYRSLGQKNLLVSDNQTRQFDALSESEKITSQFMTWGSASPEPLPRKFPRFELDFDAASITD